MNKILIYTAAVLTITFSLNSCKPKDEGPSTELKKAAIANYTAIVYANYSDALSAAQNLKTKIDVFVSSPSQATFDEAKQAWLAARLPYGQTEVFRFSDGPIDDADGPEGLINAWPMDEAYIDYVQGSPTTGIINNVVTYPTIDKSLLESLNEVGGETNISCGFHAIEFLLWGQDLSSSSAGNRPYTDYVVVGGTALNQSRRGDYLKAAAELLVENLQSVTTEWVPSRVNYRSSIENGNVDATLTKIIQGMGFLSKGELAGERLEVAYDTQLQEDEHSCFSDNTHNDIRMNALGIYNVFNGSYTRTDNSVVSGTSILDIIKAKDAALADVTKLAIEDGKDKAYLIDAPFDQQILSNNPIGRQKVKDAIDALKLQGDKIALSAQSLGLSIIVQ